MTLIQHDLPWNAQEQPLVTPPGDHLDDDPELAQAERTAVEAETTLRDAERAVEGAQTYLRAAQEQDALTAAKAEADGEPDPGRVGELAAEEAIANAQHRVRTLRERARSARSDFHELLREGAPVRRRRWLGEADDAATYAIGLFEEAARVLDHRGQKKALVQWQTDGGTKFAPTKTEVQRELAEVDTKLRAMALAARNGEMKSSAERIAEIEADKRAMATASLERAHQLDKEGAYDWRTGTRTGGEDLTKVGGGAS